MALSQSGRPTRAALIISGEGQESGTLEVGGLLSLSLGCTI